MSLQCCQDAVPSIHELHNLLSGNVAVITFVFLLLHPNLVCKTKMVYFGKFACFLYIDVGKGATISATCWTNVLVTIACGACHLFCGNSEIKRGKRLDCYPVHELSCLAPTGLLVTETQPLFRSFFKGKWKRSKEKFPSVYLQLSCCLCWWGLGKVL